MAGWSLRSLSLGRSRSNAWIAVALALSLLVGSVVVTGVPLALAGSATYSNSLTGASPTYNRVAGNAATGAAVCNQAYSVGTSVFYQAQTFTGNITGLDDILNASNTINTISPSDSFFTLYQGSFNPATPTANCYVGNDDRDAFSVPGDRRAEIVTTLTAGTTYILVT